MRLELQKKSILSKSLNRDSSGELDSMNNEILKRQFDSFMIQMNTFSSDIIKLDIEVASMSKDKKLMSEQLDIKIKIEERKKNLLFLSVKNKSMFNYQLAQIKEKLILL